MTSTFYRKYKLLLVDNLFYVQVCNPISGDIHLTREFKDEESAMRYVYRMAGYL